MEETTKLERRPIASTLRAMKPGDTERFPIEQYNAIRNSKDGTMIKERLLGWVFKVTPHRKGDEMYTLVERVS